MQTDFEMETRDDEKKKERLMFFADRQKDKKQDKEDRK